jgi:hypothetical protein
MNPDHLTDFRALREKYAVGIDDAEENFAIRFWDQAELAAFVRRHDVRSV